MQPKVDKVSEFKKSWWKWWKGLQPEWRAVSDVVGDGHKRKRHAEKKDKKAKKTHQKCQKDHKRPNK